MKKEHLLIIAVGFLILGYVLDAVVNPLASQLNLSTPYHFFTIANMSRFPFTYVSVLLKALGVIIGMLITLTSLGLKKFAKAGVLLVLSGLLQLYALQDVATQAYVVPLEWSLGFTLAGLLLFIPIIVYVLASLFETHDVFESSPLDDQSPS